MNIFLTSTIDDCITLTAKQTKDSLGLQGKKCYVFCEDRISLNIEKEIASLYGGFFGVQVFTFKRYVKSRLPKSTMLSKEASCMVVRKIITSLDSELKYFKASSYKPNLALTIFDIISQLDSARITPQELIETNKSQDKNLSPILKNKISDIALIYLKYKEHLSMNNLLDSSDYLSLMPDLICSDNELKNAKIIVSGYLSATRQRQDIFRSLNSITNDFNAVILGDDNSDVYTNDTLNKIREIDRNIKITNSNTPLTSELLGIKNYLYNPEVFKKNFTGVSSKNVSIQELSTPISEIENVAKQISILIKKGERFKDNALLVGDLNSYYQHVVNVFSEYEIPYYVDKSRTLLDHPLAQYVLSFIDLIRKGFSVENFIKMISSSIFIVDKGVSDKFKNYIYKNAFTRENLKVPFDKDGSEFEVLRQTLYSCYLKGQKAKTLSEFVLATQEMLEKTGAIENVNALGEKLKSIGELSLAEYNEKAPSKIESILSEMVVVAGDTQIKTNDFKNMFSSGAKALEIDSIPLFNDAVYVGECKSSKNKNVKNLFVVGLNGDVPFAKSDTALLTDSDLMELDKVKIIVEPKIEFVNKREKESVALSLMSFNEKLFLSYSQTTNDGKESFKSEVVKYFEKIFKIEPKKERKGESLDKLVTEEEKERYLSAFSSPRTIYKELASVVADIKSSDKTSKILLPSFNQAVEELGLDELKENANLIYSYKEPSKELNEDDNDYFYNGFVSATAVEKYFTCPYNSYVKNVLKLQDNESGEMKVYETGTLLHSVVEKYVSNIDTVSDLKESNILVEKVVKEVLSEPDYAKFLNKPQYKFVFYQLEKESKRVCFAIFNSLKNSLFKPYLLEVPFGEKETFKPIKLTANGCEYKLQGKVDRIDKYNDNIRIIDYKTGTISSSDESFYTGRKIQLYLYMNAFVGEELKPSGAYYFPVHDGFSKKEDRNYLMRGKTVDEEEIIEATDCSLDKGKKSEHVAISINKDGSLAKRSETLTKDEMKKYLDYAVKIAEKGVEEMTKGFIKPTPYEGACTYCEYGGMCGFDAKRNGERVASRVSKNTIISAVDSQLKETKDEW